jgi:response regulator RpfG family c-di-GMP phosphodiesterase
MSELLFSEEQPKPEEPTGEPWHILVVDDEPSVHDVTRLTLGRLDVFERPIKLHSAFSAAEAREMLQDSEVSFCMAFVDVVMETQNAGLELVRWIRNELQNSEIRLILRTGQAGMAPESDVIRHYDINDYRSKTDLTAQSLSTCVYNAVRGYRDITTIAQSLGAFRKLIDTSANLLKEDSLTHLASSAFKGLLSILNMESSSLYIIRRQKLFGELNETVIACSGNSANTNTLNLEDLPTTAREKIELAFQVQSTQVTETNFIGYFSTGRGSGSVLYVDFNDDATHFRSNIVEIFATQAVLIFENLSRQIELETSQKELMYIVGDAIEARSLETGSHVKRVAIFCGFFAQELNKDPDYVSAIKIAAPLHDIGKIAIPETILHKPGKLDADEWEIMMTHAAAGGTILEKSNLPVAKLGARLARWHHENWNGSGYPDGLAGEDIPLEARIMAIADVFDALGAKRSYKEPWPNDKILEFIVEEKGKKFDPQLVDIIVEKFDDLIELRNQYPD